MIKDITPRVDIAFKKLFGTEENKDLLISLINSIVAEEDRVVDITVLNPYNPRNFRNDKLSILDIKASSYVGMRYNIEIQISDEADYDKRALYYWAKLYTEQLEVRDDYSELNKAIGIHILNFTSIPTVKKYHNVFQLREVESNFHYFKDIELHTIELNKFDDSQRRIPDKAEELKLLLPKIRSSLDRWMTFLSRHDLLDSKNLPEVLDAPELKKALDVLEMMNFTKQEREAYEDHVKWLRIEANTLKKAEGKGFMMGKEFGIKEGIEKGIEKIARNMLAKNKSIKEIIEITGLSAAEIKKLGG